ncbi:MAG: DUF6878 family protein [Beijerinckiaceae bacterium]
MSTHTPHPSSPTPDAVAEVQPAPAVPDYAALEAAHQSLSARLHPANKADLFAVLAGAGIATVTVEFDGYGDSGQIESVDALGKDGVSCDLPSTSLAMRRALWGEPEPASEEMTVAEAIERLAYDLLGGAHPGWEINDGSYGTFVFDVAMGAITLECNVRFTDSERHTSTF